MFFREKEAPIEYWTEIVKIGPKVVEIGFKNRQKLYFFLEIV